MDSASLKPVPRPGILDIAAYVPGKEHAPGVARAHEALLLAYGVIERQLQGREWAAGDVFSMADCAAAPALFYAVTYVPLPATHERLAAYFERLVQRPSVARTIEEARPFFKFYPGRAGLAARFLEAA